MVFLTVNIETNAEELTTKLVLKDNLRSYTIGDLIDSARDLYFNPSVSESVLHPLIDAGMRELRPERVRPLVKNDIILTLVAPVTITNNPKRIIRTFTEEIEDMDSFIETTAFLIGFFVVAFSDEHYTILINKSEMDGVLDSTISFLNGVLQKIKIKRRKDMM